MNNPDNAYVNVSCADIYMNPTYHSEICTQSVLWEKLIVLDSNRDFIYVKTQDNYRGWINRHQVSFIEANPGVNWALITENFVRFLKMPDPNSNIIRDGVAGSSLPVVFEKNSWIKTYLPDNSTGWIEKNCLGDYRKLNRDDLIRYASSFTGIPYVWGGKTVKGFDCSGFIQFVCKMYNRIIRRDAWMQYEDSKPVSNKPLGGQPGDLIFFSENSDKITHVGFCFEPGIVLHCQGMVKLNSLRKGDMIFDQKLLNNFVEIRTFF